MQKISLTLVFLFISMCMLNAIAGPPPDSPPPPPGGGHGGGANQQGAPIDGGLVILIAFGAGYGSYKLYKSRKAEKKAGEVTD